MDLFQVKTEINDLIKGYTKKVNNGDHTEEDRRFYLGSILALRELEERLETKQKVNTFPWFE